MTIKTLRLSILVLIPLVAMACAHVGKVKVKSINDNETIYLEDPLEEIEGDWVTFYCPVHRQMLYSNHFFEYKKCFKKAQQWHKKRHIPFMSRKSLLYVGI